MMLVAAVVFSALVALWGCVAYGRWVVHVVTPGGKVVLTFHAVQRYRLRVDSRTAEFVKRNAWVARALGTEQITAQLEALTPPELEEVVGEAIRAQLDVAIYESVLVEEQDVRVGLLARLDARS